MGFIDSDAHVYENELTWSYFDPREVEYRPVQIGGAWVTDSMPSFSTKKWDSEEYNRLFPEGSADLTDVDARLRRMDDLGVDVQVLFSSWWLNASVHDPFAEAAIARSWNRWMADAVSDSGGRLRWTLQAPVRIAERAIEEMEFGHAHGAVGVLITGLRHGLGPGDRSYWPIYEKAEELGLVITVHVGGDRKVWATSPHRMLYHNVLPVVSAFHEILSTGLPDRFPGLKWAFLEAGAAWVPYALQELLRVTGVGLGTRSFVDWRPLASDVMSTHKMYVATQMDDDIPYLAQFTGPANLILGTDYGHLDVGSDPDALSIVAGRRDGDPELFRNIVDVNARQLFGIDPRFTPASTHEVPLAR